jgi:hypothetical protein
VNGDAYEHDKDARVAIDQGLQLMKVLHDTFSRSDLPAKAAIFKQLLADKHGLISEHVLQRAVEDTFPPSLPDYLAARDLLTRHLNVYESYSRDVILAALVVSKQGHAPGTFSAGKAVALFCNALGGAYIKCAQRAESDRSLPPRLREDLRIHLAHLKFDGERPSRIELWHLIDREPEMLRSVQRVGKVEGSASTAVAVNFELHDGGCEIAALMRAFAQERLSFGFGKIATTAESYGSDSAVGRTLGRIARSSEKRAAIECDCAVAPKQYTIGQCLFGGVWVDVDGRRVDYDSARVTVHGRTFYRMTKMEGTVLAKVLKDRHETDDAQDFAMSDVAVFVCHAVHGVFDSDRHSGQANVNNRTLGQYDMKALAVDQKTLRYREWKDDDFQQVAEILAALLTDKTSLSFEKFVDAERVIADSGRQVSELVTELQTALMALGDRFAVLSPEQIKAAVIAGLKRGMHPGMAKALTAQILEKAPIPAMMRGLIRGGLEKGLASGNLDGPIMSQALKLLGPPAVAISINLPPGWRDRLYAEAYSM